jgi:hypothetical protein
LSDYVQVRHTRREAGIRTPVRAYYQYGESPYQSKPKNSEIESNCVIVRWGGK